MPKGCVFGLLSLAEVCRVCEYRVCEHRVCEHRVCEHRVCDYPDMVTWLPHIFDAAEDPIANIRHSIINCVGTVERNPTLLVCKVYEPKLFLAIDDLSMGFVNIGFVNIGFVNIGFVNIGFVCIGFEKHGLLLSQYGWPLKNNRTLPGSWINHVPGKGLGLGFSLSGPTSGEGSGVRGLAV